MAIKMSTKLFGLFLSIFLSASTTRRAKLFSLVRNKKGERRCINSCICLLLMDIVGVTSAGWVRAQGPKEPSFHARPLKSALKKSNAPSSASNSPSTPSTPVPTPTQEGSGGLAVNWQEPPPPPPPARCVVLICQTVFQFWCWLKTNR